VDYCRLSPPFLLLETKILSPEPIGAAIAIVKCILAGEELGIVLQRNCWTEKIGANLVSIGATLCPKLQQSSVEQSSSRCQNISRSQNHFYRSHNVQFDVRHACISGDRNTCAVTTAAHAFW
jgi:hypothetical protein